MQDIKFHFVVSFNLKKMKQKEMPPVRIELTAPSLQDQCSAPELRRPCSISINTGIKQFRICCLQNILLQLTLAIVTLFCRNSNLHDIIENQSSLVLLPYKFNIFSILAFTPNSLPIFARRYLLVLRSSALFICVKMLVIWHQPLDGAPKCVMAALTRQCSISLSLCPTV